MTRLWRLALRLKSRSTVTCRLFNLSAGISLALSMGTAVLWVHSYWADDFLSVAHASAQRGVDPDGPRPHQAWHCTKGSLSGEANCGRVEIWYRTVDEWLYVNEAKVERGFRVDGWTDRNRANAFAGQPWLEWSNTFDVGGVAALRIPLLALLFLTALLPAIAFWRIAHRRGQMKTSCRVCGYDLRATPGLCPECGAGYAEGGGQSSPE